jgi:small subunit ribosomal protein S1
VNTDDGLYEVTVPGASTVVGDWSDLVEGAVVEARVTGSNTGGLEVLVNHIRGFIPASHISLFRVDSFAEYIGQKILCVVTEVNRRRRKLVLSRRAVLEREREDARRRLLEQIEVGQTREGVVRSLREFGAFVDLGGVDGLIHISQLSWDRVEHPSEVLKEGDRIKVRVESVDLQTGRVGLSYRNLLEHPWSNVERDFPAGAIVTGVVSRIAKFGAFVKLAPGVEGLVHISELAHQHVHQVSSVVKEGQEVEVKVLSVDPQEQRISLSLKGALPEPAEEPSLVGGEEEGPPARPLAAPKPLRPLKGGTDRQSGGEKFGLKW